jgi:signal transduction histidine kinase
MIPRFKSIVSRILWLHIVAIVVTSIAVIAAIYFVLGSTAATFEDQVLRDHADTIALYLSVDPDGNIDLGLPADIHTVYAHSYGGFAYAVVDQSGKVLFSSRSDNEPILASDPRQAAPLYFQHLQRRPLYYGASIPKHLGDRPVWIQVGQDLEDPDVIIDDIVADFLGRVAWFTIPIMLLLVAIDIAVVRRALRPVVSASEMARTINPARIDLRLPTEDLPREVLPLVDAVNQAFDRLEAGFRVQREFTADAAHELRTPLSVLRTRIDTLSDHEVAGVLRIDVEVMSRIVEQLLAIAEIEHFPIDLAGTADLQDICADVTGFIAPLALAQGKKIALIGAQNPVLVKGDRQALFQAIRNLAENAIEHTAPGTTVEIAVYAEGIVHVLDKGPGVPERDRQHIFQRFWRGDRQRGGAGLGLSIVTRIAEAHGGSIVVENRLMGGAVFILTLTLA